MSKIYIKNLSYLRLFPKSSTCIWCVSNFIFIYKWNFLELIHQGVLGFWGFGVRVRIRVRFRFKVRVRVRVRVRVSVREWVIKRGAARKS